MFSMQPRTYNEALRYTRCLTLKQFIPGVTDEFLWHIYNFISADNANKIGISNGTVSFYNAAGECIDAVAVTTAGSFDRIVLSATLYRVINKTTESSGCGCGCSSNNNNNNNNNNNG